MAQETLEENLGKQFYDFLERFSQETQLTPESSQNGGTVKDYVDQADRMHRNDRTTMYVDFDHVASYDPALAEAMEEHYYRVEPALRDAVRRFVAGLHPDLAAGDKTFQVSVFNLPFTTKIRDLKMDRVGRLTCVSGTVTRTSEVRPELLEGCFDCAACGKRVEGVTQQFCYTEPKACPACKNSSKWSLDTKRSKFADWQRVRVQENTSEIPAGCMPRTLDVILRDEAVERAKAGDRAVFVGTLVVTPEVAHAQATGDRVEATSRPEGRAPTDGVTGLKTLGVRDMHYRIAFVASSVAPADARFGYANIREEANDAQAVFDSFTAAEKDEVDEMRARRDVYNLLAKSIAPTVFGHEEVKRGVLLLLMGGVHKQSPTDGARLRGDINVCLVGDPSTAKSQFLKYVCNILPRAVYASGKASTAAGLTASVTKDEETGEHAIEAGALMLADNGICCIDEFDKMETRDQVAIHEAMEQQTISIAKAGIRATLNARASILAAANPIGGRYDRAKSLSKNMSVSGPVMSRFDLFFVVLDESDAVADYNIARHIVQMHQHRQLANTAASPAFTTAQLQRYIKYARSLRPRMGAEARALLSRFYVGLRSESHAAGSSMAQRITVRQLEAMIRLSEALARVHLDDTIRPRYVRESFRLLRKSVVHVRHADVGLDDDEGDGADADAEAAEDALLAEALAAAGEGLDAAADADEDEGADEARRGGGARAGSALTAAQQPRAKKVVTITFVEFERIKQVLLRRLKREEVAAAAQAAAAAEGAPAGEAVRAQVPGVGDDDLPEAEVAPMPGGLSQAGATRQPSGAVRRRDLVTHYLDLLQLDDEEELARHRKLVDLVVGKLIASERVVQELKPPGGHLPADKGERFLVLHAGVEV